MNIVLAASEAFPFCKTGGLADVCGSKPLYNIDFGGNVEGAREGELVELRHFPEHCGWTARERSRLRPPCRDESD